MNVTTRLNKLCQISDFPVLHAYFRELGMQHTPGAEHRKQWELAMAICTFTECVGASGPVRALGIGAGRETTIYWLTNHCEQVHATDLYGDPGNWQEASPAFLIDPASIFDHFPWHPRRLIVQHMNGCDLRYEDATFDFIFSSSSIEHFGSFEQVCQAMREMERVLKPGGALSLSTEFKIAGPGKGFDNVLTFDTDDLCRLIEVSGLRMIDVLELLPEPGHTASFQRVFTDIAEFGHAREFPHIKLEAHGYEWTSVHLALRKPLNRHDQRGVTVAQWRELQELPAVV